MDLYKEEIIFAGDFLEELRNSRIRKFPYQTKAYQQTLEVIKEQFKSEGKIPKPLNTLLIPEFLFGNFPRIDNAIQHYMGTKVSILTPSFNEFIILDASPSEVRNPLAKKFAGLFIEGLGLK